MLPDVIQLELKARHFEGACYLELRDCPIARAAREQLSLYRVLVGGCNAELNDIIFRFPDYKFQEMFLLDKAAALNQPPETVIRTITLTKQPA